MTDATPLQAQTIRENQVRKALADQFRKDGMPGVADLMLRPGRTERMNPYIETALTAMAAYSTHIRTQERERCEAAISRVEVDENNSSPTQVIYDCLEAISPSLTIPQE